MLLRSERLDSSSRIVVVEVVGEGDEVVKAEDDEEQDHDMEVAGGPEVGVVDSDYGSCSSFSGY